MIHVEGERDSDKYMQAIEKLTTSTEDVFLQYLSSHSSCTKRDLLKLPTGSKEAEKKKTLSRLISEGKLCERKDGRRMLVEIPVKPS